MTENEARYLARRNPRHCARYLRGEWVVWDTQFDDEVVFDRADYIEATDERTPPWLKDWLNAGGEKKRT